MPLKPHLTIAGGGLAGLALGITLRQQDIPVTLLEAQAYPRHRLCGEFLHGHGEQILHRLGVADQIPPDTPRHRTVLWQDHTGPLASHQLPRPTLGLSRYWLDQTLAQHFQNLGGTLTIRRLPETQLTPRPGLIRTTGRQRQKSPWFGIKTHLKGLTLHAGLEMHLGRHGYLGLTPVEDGWINACGIFRAQNLGPIPAAQRLAHILHHNQLPQLAQQVARAQHRSGSLCAIAGLRLGQQPATSQDHARLGDSATCPAPLTGNGQSMALESALLAAPALIAWHHNQQNWPQTLQQIHQTLSRHQTTRSQLGLQLHHLILKRPTQHLLRLALKTNKLPLNTLAKHLTS